MIFYLWESFGGTRAAQLLEPRKREFPLGTSLKSRLLVHNSGKQSVFFIMPSWQQSSKHAAHDAKDSAIKVTSTSWMTMSRMRVYRLAPGAYCESYAPGIGVGDRTDNEDWANVGVGSWILAKAGDDVRFSPGAIEVRMSPFVVGTRHMNGFQKPKDAVDLCGQIPRSPTNSGRPRIRPAAFGAVCQTMGLLPTYNSHNSRVWSGVKIQFTRLKTFDQNTRHNRGFRNNSKQRTTWSQLSISLNTNRVSV